MLSVHGALHRIASTLQSKGNLSSSLNILPCPALPCRPAQFKGKTVLLGVDDMDVFKGIELKLQAFEQVLAHHPEWRGKLVLVQVTSAARWGCGSRAGGVVSVGGEGAWGLAEGQGGAAAQPPLALPPPARPPRLRSRSHRV